MKMLPIIPIAALAAVVLGYVAWVPPTGEQSSPTEARYQQNPPQAAGEPEPVNPAEREKKRHKIFAAANNVGQAGCEFVTHYLPAGDGTTVEAYSCEPVDPAAPHPYKSYSNKALESLAYSDARAAEILGMRLRETDEVRALSLTMRASALSGGDVMPIIAFNNAYPHPDEVNGVPVQQSVHVKFVLAAVIELLGAGDGYVAPWEALVREASPRAEREIEMLHERAREIVEEMRKIQLDVTGTSTIGGPSDA